MRMIEILHLEDCPLDASLIHTWLERESVAFRVSIERVGGEAEFRSALRSKTYDLILADYSLPGFDGLAALEIARRECPDLPFLFVTGTLGEEVAVETLKRGATDFVLKQRLERLAPAVSRALAEARERLERQRAEAALQQRQIQHRLILDSIKDHAIITTDVEGRVTHWSSGAEELFGLESAAMLGWPISRISRVQDVQAGTPELERIEAQRRGRLETENWYTRADGTEFWGSGMIMPLCDEQGRIQGFTQVLRNLTARKRAEEAMVEADRRKDEFLAILAHELRNPLSALHNATQLIRRFELPPERMEWAKEVLAHQLNHLTRLVDDLLDISRITRGKIQLRRERIGVASIVNRAIETTRSLLEERQHEIGLSVAPGSLWVEADPVRLEQVIVNLLANAAKYTEKQGRIAISIHAEGDELVVRVRDNGIGLTPSMCNRVFDLFIQVDPSLDRTHGGLGIGLTVARKLIELHGGRIMAESEGLGQGSTFSIFLPAAEPPEEERPACWSLDTATDSRTGQKILLVDDSLHSACALAELLRGSGHEVQTVHDGREALEVARRDLPDVVLLDIGLPSLDGYQVARQLRQEGHRRAVIIAITGYGEEQALRRSREAGFDYHMLKPVDYEALLALLDQSASEVRSSRRVATGMRVQRLAPGNLTRSC